MIACQGITVIVVRHMWHAGRQHSPGDELRVLPAEAAAAVGSGRAKLQNPEDRAAVDAALRSERDRTLARCGRIPGEPLRFGRY
jgi:hypothetical protein